VIAYARLAEKLLHLPIFYLEYSGTSGEVELVKNVKAEWKQAQLYYGGGISNAEQAKEMARYDDTVVGGNIIYDDIKSA
ncbi:geranylgeranylglyceryl/heptaprenylglyceryl phosphate synthase, partial [Bacillus thuringiensis]